MPPVNDDFANRIVLAAGGGTRLGDTCVDATYEAGEPQEFSPSSDQTVWYEFQPNTTGYWNFTVSGLTAGSQGTYTEIDVFEGNTFSTMERFGQGTGYGSTSPFTARVYLSSAIVYKIQVAAPGFGAVNDYVSPYVGMSNTPFDTVVPTSILFDLTSYGTMGGGDKYTWSQSRWRIFKGALGGQLYPNPAGNCPIWALQLTVFPHGVFDYPNDAWSKGGGHPGGGNIFASDVWPYEPITGTLWNPTFDCLDGLQAFYVADDGVTGLGEIVASADQES